MQVWTWINLRTINYTPINPKLSIFSFNVLIYSLLTHFCGPYKPDKGEMEKKDCESREYWKTMQALLSHVYWKLKQTTLRNNMDLYQSLIWGQTNNPSVVLKCPSQKSTIPFSHRAFLKQLMIVAYSITTTLQYTHVHKLLFYKRTFC